MTMTSRILAPGPHDNVLRTTEGALVNVPKGWRRLPPGDATLTRRVKSAGEHWVVREVRGKRVYSRGVWAPSETIRRIRAELAAERSTPAYARQQAGQARRRERVQAGYVEEFAAAIVEFLKFPEQHRETAIRLARAVAAHATPIGSGTIARTQRVPISSRASIAVFAWLRHHTTNYDWLPIPRQKGSRRAVRREMALRSKRLLDHYRRGDPAPSDCPLQRALDGKSLGRKKLPLIIASAEREPNREAVP